MIYGINAANKYINELDKLIKTQNAAVNWIQPLKHGLTEYVDINPQCSYNDILAQFGTPEEIITEYLNTSDLVYKKSKNRFIQISLICIGLLLIIIASFFIYKANQITIATNEYIILDVSEN